MGAGPGRAGRGAWTGAPREGDPLHLSAPQRKGPSPRHPPPEAAHRTGLSAPLPEFLPCRGAWGPRSCRSNQFLMPVWPSRAEAWVSPVSLPRGSPATQRKAIVTRAAVWGVGEWEFWGLLPPQPTLCLHGVRGKPSCSTRCRTRAPASQTVSSLSSEPHPPTHNHTCTPHAHAHCFPNLSLTPPPAASLGLNGFSLLEGSCIWGGGKYGFQWGGVYTLTWLQPGGQPPQVPSMTPCT